jgi:DhnA family fructose-bisphosphate aldolase class Ia
MSYTGMDREWILRIVEEGTTNRMAGTRNGRLSGNRGRIIGRSFFQQSSQRAMKEAVSYIDKMIQEIIQKEYGK